MIIVKTKNGDRFINDKAVTRVEHVRDEAEVNAYGDKGYLFGIGGVEGIFYTNDAQPTMWKDEGSEVERLNEALEKRREELDKIRYELIETAHERDELKERLAQLEPKPANEYENDKLADKLYHEIDRLDIQVREENRKNNPQWVWQKQGNAKRFIHIAQKYDIETVGQLLEIGRVRFEQYRNMGRQCADRISEALDNLYGIKDW